jgi:hypothetical protein
MPAYPETLHQQISAPSMQLQGFSAIGKFTIAKEQRTQGQE